MRRFVLCGGVAATAIAMAGCGGGGHAPSTTAKTSSSEMAPLPPRPAPPGAVEVSPGGVTTKVDVPADATESQYGQACHAARLWMDTQHADAKTLVEPYLRLLQAPGFTGPGNFNTPWTKLTPAQQAGVILAVSGAANGDCS